MSSQVQSIVDMYGKDATRLMDIFHKVMNEKGCVSDEDMADIASQLGMSKVDVEQTLSFYHFYAKDPIGKYVIYLNNSLVAEMMGRAEVATAFEKATGAEFGGVSDDGLFGLFDTACIGMNDQEPAAIINGVVFPKITSYRVKELIKSFREGKTADEMVNSFGGGERCRADNAGIFDIKTLRQPYLAETQHLRLFCLRDSVRRGGGVAGQQVTAKFGVCGLLAHGFVLVVGHRLA